MQPKNISRKEFLTALGGTLVAAVLAKVSLPDHKLFPTLSPKKEANNSYGNHSYGGTAKS